MLPSNTTIWSNPRSEAPQSSLRSHNTSPITIPAVITEEDTTATPTAQFVETAEAHATSPGPESKPKFDTMEDLKIRAGNVLDEVMAAWADDKAAYAELKAEFEARQSDYRRLDKVELELAERSAQLKVLRDRLTSITSLLS